MKGRKDEPKISTADQLNQLQYIHMKGYYDIKIML